MNIIFNMARWLILAASLAVIVLITYVWATPINEMLGMVDPGAINPGPDDLRRMVRMGIGIVAALVVQMVLRTILGAFAQPASVPSLSKD